LGLSAITEARRSTALRRAAVRATLAPSVHNTQPWRLVLFPNALEVRADWMRQLRVLDGRGRQLLISCGCALFNGRVALAAAGLPVALTLPRVAAPLDVVGRLDLAAVTNAPNLDPAIGHLDAVVEVRQTNRRQFLDDDVPADLIELLTAAAGAEGASLTPVVREADRATLARLSQSADKAENADPAYRAELRMWTTTDAQRLDGVPAYAVPHVDGFAGDDIPIRDFDTHGEGSLPSYTRSSVDQCLLLLGTSEDEPLSWIRAGQALERVLLEIALHGYTASLFTQVIEVPATRGRLRQELRLSMHPHVVLRVGRAPATPATRRRRLVDVLEEAR
jgi:nitroreductase